MVATTFRRISHFRQLYIAIPCAMFVRTGPDMVECRDPLHPGGVDTRPGNQHILHDHTTD